MANPVQVREFFAAAFDALAGVELTAHFHNTRGQGLANVLAALEAGVDELRVVASASSAAARSRPGRPATSRPRTSSRCCTRWGSRPGIDLAALIEASRAAQDVLGRPLGSHVLLAGPVEWRLSDDATSSAPTR